jgi:hypothetical protein
VIGTIKNTTRIFWGVTTLGVVEVFWRFGETYYLHLQGRRMIGTSQQAGSSNLSDLMKARICGGPLK